MKKLVVKYRLQILMLCFFACTILIRISFWQHISGDMSYHLLGWCNFINSHEGMSAYAHRFSDYPPLYTYLLGIIVKITPLNWVTGIKLISSFFDYLLAFYVYKIISLKHGKSLWTILAACTVSILPTVLINSSMWGQCDSMYVTFIIMSIYYTLVNKYVATFVFYGLAFSLKLQSVFILPFFAVLFLSVPEVKFWHFSFIPLIYFITILPCYLAGRSFINLISIYAEQAKDCHQHLSLNATNIYQLLPNSPLELYKAGIFFSAAIALLIVFIFTYKIDFNKETIIDIAFMSALLLPFFLPFMHERYFYLADILAVIYVFYHKRSAFLLVIPFLSLMSYMPCLLQLHVIDMKFLSLTMLITVGISSKSIVLKYLKR